MLFIYVFGFVWINKDVGNVNMFLNVFTKILVDCFTLKGQSDIDNTPKSITYKGFKCALSPELYLSVDIPELYRKALSNFRC